LQTTISSDKINWNTSADMITIPSYFYDSSNYYEIAEIKSTQAQNSFSTFSGNLFIEGGVKKIGENAFYNSSVKKVYIDEGVEEIGKNAFYNCSNITDIYLPSTIREIANNAFSNIATNAKIHLPNVSTLNYSMVKLPYHSVYDFAKQHSGIAAIND
jgi:hypothetical protein